MVTWWCSVVGERINVWFQQGVKNIEAGAEQVVSDMAIEGERMVQDMIGSRGTGRVWSHTYVKEGIPRSESKPGRVWTGDMQKNIESDVVTKPGSIAGSFGWIHTYKDYYGLQEGGFTQADTGLIITGMFAMADAADWAQHEFETRMKGVANDF